MSGFMKQTLEQFSRSLGDRTPTPGGGSAAAYVALLGSNLGMMTLRFSEEQPAREPLAQLEKLNAELAPLLDEDSRAYDAFQAALKLPKGTADEKARRSQAMQEALMVAAKVPLQTMRLALTGLDILGRSAMISNKNLVSDMESGVLFLTAGLKGAAANVRINAQSMKDEKKKAFLLSEMEDLVRRAEAKQAEALAALHQR